MTTRVCHICGEPRDQPGKKACSAAHGRATGSRAAAARDVIGRAVYEYEYGITADDWQISDDVGAGKVADFVLAALGRNGYRVEVTRG